MHSQGIMIQFLAGHEIFMDKYTDFLSSTTIYFCCNKATYFGLLKHQNQAVKNKLQKKNKHTNKAYTSFLSDLKDNERVVNMLPYCVN